MTVVDFVTEIVEKKVELEFQFAILKNYSMPKKRILWEMVVDK